MPAAELETGTLQHHTFIDAPPGPFPPDTETIVTKESLIPASAPEAVFPSMEATDTFQARRANFIGHVSSDTSNPAQITPGIREGLRVIFKNPVIHLPKILDIPDAKKSSSQTPRSLEEATRSYGLTEDLATEIEQLKRGQVILYRGKTAAGDPWVIGTQVDKFKVKKSRGKNSLNGAGAELERRQYPYLHEDLTHDKFVSFFLVNWDRLVPIFFNGSVPEGTTLRRYAEVTLNDFIVKTEKNKKPIKGAGMVDFIGELPDGQLVTVEFRSPGQSKTIQIARHTRGLQELLREHNGKNNIPRISQYVGAYEEDGQYSLLKLLPRFEMFKPYTSRTPKGETVIYAPGKSNTAESQID